jgi:hypothetical protein
MGCDDPGASESPGGDEQILGGRFDDGKASRLRIRTNCTHQSISESRMLHEHRVRVLVSRSMRDVGRLHYIQCDPAEVCGHLWSGEGLAQLAKESSEAVLVWSDQPRGLEPSPQHSSFVLCEHIVPDNFSHKE